jgi:O-antigen ligase
MFVTMRIEKALLTAIRASTVIFIFSIPFAAKYVSYTMFLWGACALAYSVYLRQWNPPSILLCLIASAFIVRAVWVLVADDFSYGMRSLETEFSLIILPIIFLFLPKAGDVKVLAARAYIVMCLGVIVYSFIQLFIFLQDSPWTFAEFTKFHFEIDSFWVNTRYFSYGMLNWDTAHYSFLSAMFIYAASLFPIAIKKVKTRIVMTVVYLIITFLFIVYSGSRVGLVMMIVWIVAAAIFSIRPFFERKQLVIGAIVVSLLVVGTIVALKGDVYQRVDRTRYHYGRMAIDQWKERPMLGWGTGSGKELMHDEAFEDEIGYSVNHPHNQYLSELMQFGIIGALPLFAFLLGCIYVGVMDNAKPLLLTVVSVMVLMMVESPINSNKGIVPMMLVLCLTASDLRPLTKNVAA